MKVLIWERYNNTQICRFVYNCLHKLMINMFTNVNKAMFTFVTAIISS
jgi:hypothetical protein